MAFTVIPVSDAVMLIRAFGLLFSQAGIYGPQHNVTQSAARCVFAEMERALKAFGPIEFAVSADRIMINGSGEGIAAVAGKNLFDRMTLYKVGGLLFSPPLDPHEFLSCVNLFSTPPNALAAQGGLEAALKKAGWRSIRVANVAYQRVTGEASAVPADKPQSLFCKAEPAAPQAVESAKKPVRPDVLDLSADWAGAVSAGSNTGSDDSDRPDANPALSPRRQRATALAAMLRSAAEELEKGMEQGGPALSQHEVTRALDQVRDALSEVVDGSQRDISVLASQVEEDSKTIASIESAAQRRGIGLKLTRGELVQRYAELNQEILQPLTVSTGVIDMLNSGCAGVLTEAQRELLKMASESVGRVNQLVAYMNRISGLPGTYTPDQTVISDSYRR